MCTVCGITIEAPGPMFVHLISKMGPYILHMPYKNWFAESKLNF